MFMPARLFFNSKNNTMKIEFDYTADDSENIEDLTSKNGCSSFLIMVTLVAIAITFFTFKLFTK
jgi:hypothetical protein